MPRAASPPRSEGERIEGGSSRKIVTIIFADLVGSTALHERLDPESVRGFMESYYAAMRIAVEAHGGRVTQVMGDGVKAVFGAPRVAEDDAIRAVRAAAEIQRAFRVLAERESQLVGQTGLRVAVNTGEVVTDDASEIIGDPVNVAARLQEKGRDGDVVIGGETQRIVATQVTLEPLGQHTDRARIANGIAALLGGSPAPPEETFFVVRRLLGAFAAQKPVLLVIDDLHWAEPLLFDLVEHLVQWGSGTKLLVLVGARPELRDARSSLATPGGLVADLITLAGLDAFAARGQHDRCCRPANPDRGEAAHDQRGQPALRRRACAHARRRGRAAA